MIPKVIHYCWFGGKSLPPLALKCIQSWKKYLPDYELKLWNEETFDINVNFYVKEAYQAKKYAFVTDFVRLYVLYNYGGIYMDTDVEVIKNLDHFLPLPAFSGFETTNNIPTGILGSIKNNEWIKEQMDYYSGKHFILPDGTFDTTSNTIIISGNMKNGGFRFDNSVQNYRDAITFYPNDFFCPKNYDTGKIHITQNTHCIHHFSGSWITTSGKIKKFIAKTVGENNLRPIINLKHRITGR